MYIKIFKNHIESVHEKVFYSFYDVCKYVTQYLETKYQRKGYFQVQNRSLRYKSKYQVSKPVRILYNISFWTN